MGRDRTQDDELAAIDLLDRDTAVPKGGEPSRERIAGASLGRPLAYALPPVTDDLTTVGGAPRDILLCFPFDLEELPGARDYREATLTVRLDDGSHAVTLHPAPGSTAADGAEVAAFGLGKDRLQWVFRAPGRSGALRPDGRWAQAVVRLPAAATELSGRLSLTTVTVQPVLGGAFRRREAETPQETPFRLSAADLWPAAVRPTVRQGALPGAWALASYEDTASAAGERLPPGLRRLCLAVDIEKYSARDNTGMVRLQRVLLRALREACARAGIDWHRCGRQAQGDGYLLVFEPDVDETRVVPGLLNGLAAALAEANATASPPQRVRMRACLHQGIVHEADSGYAGSAVVSLFRVLDSDPVRRALADAPATHLVAAFSDGLYQDLVSHGYSGLTATGFRRAEIHVPAKSFTGVAWIRAFPSPAPRESRAHERPAPAAEG
ncbi:hypothetical protein JK361_18835 [Streptomyces sp. 5-8]|uniref:Guanylate cyclase domain-containing protein n=1 Tax=Streptomyces musisoli TaxID=2802280 RepID=A0ABS1P3W2_9ACTN|nr:hypothetical protein [Streptomyces musisoli]MBL1106631.1 hypothetical protein [Streptomyces musisoli]